nr:hypothetical protein GCM10020092_042550 [Actinoplanes digitatis]
MARASAAPSVAAARAASWCPAASPAKAATSSPCGTSVTAPRSRARSTARPSEHAGHGRVAEQHRGVGGPDQRDGVRDHRRRAQHVAQVREGGVVVALVHGGEPGDLVAGLRHRVRLAGRAPGEDPPGKPAVTALPA